MMRSPAARSRPGLPLTFRLRAAPLLGLALLALASCEKDHVRSYTVAQPRLRLLAAVIPHGQETWAFKLVGRATAVKEHEKEFDAFVRSVRFTDDEDKPVTWRAPKGWREQDGDKGARYATFLVAAGEPPAEVRVLRLGRKATVRDAVNRWRRNELGLGPLRPGELHAVAKESRVAGHLVTRVDLTAPLPSKSAMAPPLPLTYTTPADWEETGYRATGGFPVLTAFEVNDSGRVGEVTVTTLGADPGSLLDNVNRWRRNDLRLGPIDEDDLKKERIESLTVGGAKGQYLDLRGDPEVRDARVLVAMVRKDDKTWFFKMTGRAKLVAAQEPNFRAFLHSVRFAGAADE